jgi:hypothetical protein
VYHFFTKNTKKKSSDGNGSGKKYTEKNKIAK